jgi:hypothetical protein
MRLLVPYYALMTAVPPIIRSSGRTYLRTCGSHQQTKTFVPGFRGPE